MTLMRYQPLRHRGGSAWHLADQLHDEINRLFSTHEGGDEPAVTADWVPAVDIKEEDDRFLIHVDVPGVKTEDIDVTMEDGVLTLSGTRFHEQREEKDGFRRVERVSGRFLRRFSLPETADAERIEARCKDGVLEVSIGKQEKVKPKRIEVKAD